MAHIKALVTLQVETNILEDRPVNTLHFRQDTSGEATLLAIAQAIDDAYQEVRQSLAGVVAQTGHSIKLYAMEDPEPRAPVVDTTFDFSAAPTGNSLPQEVALCCSFQGARVSGEVQARRRGRVYIGPLAEGAQETDGRPTSVTIGRVASFGNTLLAESAVQSGWKWCVYSTVDANLVVVENGWVDNAFDTVRSRGLAPTARTLFEGT